jgi:hypothetical protein
MSRAVQVPWQRPLAGAVTAVKGPVRVEGLEMTLAILGDSNAVARIPESWRLWRVASPWLRSAVRLRALGLIT